MAIPSNRRNSKSFSVLIHGKNGLRGKCLPICWTSFSGTILGETRHTEPITTSVKLRTIAARNKASNGLTVHLGNWIVGVRFPDANQDLRASPAHQGAQLAPVRQAELLNLNAYQWSYRSLAYSALACFRTGMSGSAVCQSMRKSLYASFALSLSPLIV